MKFTAVQVTHEMDAHPSNVGKWTVATDGQIGDFSCVDTKAEAQAIADKWTKVFSSKRKAT